MAKRALITGITGQDGAYLAQFLLRQGYEVHGLIRRSASAEAAPGRLEWLGIAGQPRLHDGDLTDLSSLIRAVEQARPDEVYNLAAQSFVKTSWTQPLLTAQVTGLGAANMLEAVRIAAPRARFYQASSSEMFGRTTGGALSEAAPFRPVSPYATAKVFAHWATLNYRESFGMHACAGILFNHESPLRGIEFVTRKITDGAARISLGLERQLRLGNLEARRDWGDARDFVRAMWLMLQQDQPADYVIATGRATSVRQFCHMAFAAVGLDYQEFVVSDASFLRPAEVEVLLGDPTKAASELGWTADTTLETLVKDMVEADLARLRQQPGGADLPREAGLRLRCDIEPVWRA